VRVPGVYRRQRHMPGRWFSTSTGRFLEYESLLERDWMLLMDFDPEAEPICEQPLRLRYLKDGLPASHVPDLLVWRAVGRSCAMSRARSVSLIPTSRLRCMPPDGRARRRVWGIACCRSPIGSC
jgi:hypothetical protein